MGGAFRQQVANSDGTGQERLGDWGHDRLGIRVRGLTRRSGVLTDRVASQRADKVSVSTEDREGVVPVPGCHVGD